MRRCAVTGFIALVAVMLALGGLAIAGLVANRADLSSPPGFGARLRTYLFTNVAETAPDASFPELRPRVVPKNAGDLAVLLRGIVTNLGWTVVSAGGPEQELAVEIRTPVFRFRDDMVIRWEETGDGTCSLSVRSSSRVGTGDLGANLRHVLDLYEELEKHAAGPR
jgi:uncharacterized protein (DUF1499 family)